LLKTGAWAWGTKDLAKDDRGSSDQLLACHRVVAVVWVAGQDESDDKVIWSNVMAVRLLDHLSRALSQTPVGGTQGLRRDLARIES
jgi:hypothetical protein